MLPRSNPIKQWFPSARVTPSRKKENSRTPRAVVPNQPGCRGTKGYCEEVSGVPPNIGFTTFIFFTT